LPIQEQLIVYILVLRYNKSAVVIQAGRRWAQNGFY